MNKQKILNIIISIAVISLIGIIVSITYEQTINMKKQEEQNKLVSNVEENKTETNKETENNIEKEKEDKEDAEPEQEYIGKEEDDNSEEDDKQKTKDEKAIDLAKKTWGKDDSVTFSIEEKKGFIYYVAVKSNATVISWYEINTDTWEISEYY